MPRNPREIAAEARAHVTVCEDGGYPLNLTKLATLAVEFQESVTETLTAAGLIPAEQAPEQAPEA